MENFSDVRNIQLKLGQAFSQKIPMRPSVDQRSEDLVSDDAKYMSFFLDAYRNPAAHSFQFA